MRSVSGGQNSAELSFESPTDALIGCGAAILLRSSDLSAEQLSTAADENLFQAKHLGRNQVVAAQPAAGS
jgi:PleD family two-component response regulator